MLRLSCRAHSFWEPWGRALKSLRRLQDPSGLGSRSHTGCGHPPFQREHLSVQSQRNKGDPDILSPAPLLSGTPPGNDSFYRPSLTSPARQAHKSTTPTPVLAQCLTKPRTFSPQAEPLPFAKSMRNIWSLARNYSSVTEHSNPKMRPSCRCSAQLSQH